ncbi:FAD-dependent oxidoreductase [Ferrovibrio sp.]|uniref:FAD-dependent oxidoreductase n=1 Tax=Ferrovibrio sp. TaxID=1917215 RepID=UPI0035B389BD
MRTVTVLQHIAIVGSGPAGLFTADALIRQRPELKIDVFERLPTPYGLARFGVAPDHQGTKAITRQFDRLFGNPNIRFLGDLAVGETLPLAVLRDYYDAVVLAVGAHQDRRLGIPGEALPGVYGSMAFVGWYNGHPDFTGLSPLLDMPGVAIVGQGNVAVDIARVLSKTPAEMATADLCAHAAGSIQAAAIRDIYLIGRRGPIEASFTSAELAELGKLERVRPVVNKADLPESLPETASGDLKIKERNLQLLHDYAARSDDKPIRLHFVFHSTPDAILGESRAEALQIRNAATPLPVGTVISAIGYGTAGFGDLPAPDAAGRLPNQDGQIAPGLYTAGWAKRGPSGTIPTNRSEAKSVADKLLADFANDAAPAKPGSAALDGWLNGKGLQAVDYAAWKRIEAAETAAARPGAPREKLAEWAALRKAAQL